MKLNLTAARLEEIVSKAVVWSPVWHILWLTIGVLISFLVAYFNGNVTIYLPFISENGAIVPEMGIFSTTLIFGSLIGAIIVLYRYKVAANIIPEDCTLAHKANVLGVLAGEVSMAGLAGVAAFPMSTVLVVHLIAAGIHFGLAMVYLFLQTYISMKTVVPYYSRYTTIVRAVLSVTLLTLLILLCICLPIAYFTWLKLYPERKHALKTPEDQMFALLVASALFEWLFYTTFLSFTFTFTKEFRHFVPSLTARPAEDSSAKLGNGSNGFSLPTSAE